MAIALRKHNDLIGLDTNDATDRSVPDVGLLRAHVLHSAEEHAEGQS